MAEGGAGAAGGAGAGEEAQEVLTPPENFAMVDSGIYRSGFPTKKNFAFLRELGIRTVVYLCPEEYPPANAEFLQSIGATFKQHGLQGNKEPFADIPADKVTAALLHVLNRKLQPVLIHCNKGKHRTGCVVGCLRKIQRWSLASVFEEYRKFADPKPRFSDIQFIELYDTRPVLDALGKGSHLQQQQAAK
jgi:tyrosine-protein phosphatase SIW14